MGQAKMRGSKDQRIAQAMVNADTMKKEVAERSAAVQRALKEIPKPGKYLSTYNPNLRFIVDDVWISQPEDEEYAEGFFLVQLVDADKWGDMESMGYELDPQEWRNFVKEHQLFLSAPLKETELD